MARELTVQLPTRRATRRLGTALAQCVEPGDLVFLEGDLGVGKTFFVRGVARALGVPSAVPVTSPTFGLVHELTQSRLPIVHSDLYRLVAADEIFELGIVERIGNDALVLVEWGLRFAEVLGDGLLVSLTFTDDIRQARLQAPSGRPAALLEALAASAGELGLELRPPT